MSTLCWLVDNKVTRNGLPTWRRRPRILGPSVVVFAIEPKRQHVPIYIKWNTSWRASCCSCYCRRRRARGVECYQGDGKQGPTEHFVKKLWSKSVEKECGGLVGKKLCIVDLGGSVTVKKHGVRKPFLCRRCRAEIGMVELFSKVFPRIPIRIIILYMSVIDFWLSMYKILVQLSAYPLNYFI